MKKEKFKLSRNKFVAAVIGAATLATGTIALVNMNQTEEINPSYSVSRVSLEMSASNNLTDLDVRNIPLEKIPDTDIDVQDIPLETMPNQVEGLTASQIYNKYDIRNYAYPKLGEDLNSGVDAKEIADKLGIKHNSFITSTSDLNGSLVFYGEYIGEDECEKIVNRLKELGQIGANANVQIVSKYNYINDIQSEVPTHVR